MTRSILKNRKRGFTLVEAIVAMGVATVVSFLAVSVALMSNSVCKKADARFAIVNEIGNLLECYKSTATPSEFENAVKYCYTAQGQDPAENPLNYFVFNERDTGDVNTFVYYYTVYLDENYDAIAIEPVLVETDALNVQSYTGNYSYNIVVTLSGTVDPLNPYVEFTAAAYRAGDTEDTAYEMESGSAFRKAGVYQNV